MSQSTATDGREVTLRLDDVHTYYGSIHALKGISIEVREGEIVTLIGANGAGKSTTLRSINGLNTPREGRIVFNGKEITRASPHRIVGMGISQSPEGRRLFPHMSVLENLEMGAFQRRDRSQIREDLDRVYSLFPRLAERKNQRGGTLSGGEQPMCAIGRLGAVIIGGCRDAVAARQLGFVPSQAIGTALEMAQARAGRPPRVGFLLSPPYFPIRVASGASGSG